jgi:hypothetical protein
MKVARLTDKGSGASDADHSADEIALRLFSAFSQIADPDRRAEVFALAEMHASKSPKYAELLLRLQTKH